MTWLLSHRKLITKNHTSNIKHFSTSRLATNSIDSQTPIYLFIAIYPYNKKPFSISGYVRVASGWGFSGEIVIIICVKCWYRTISVSVERLGVCMVTDVIYLTPNTQCTHTNPHLRPCVSTPTPLCPHPSPSTPLPADKNFTPSSQSVNNEMAIINLQQTNAISQRLYLDIDI